MNQDPRKFMYQNSIAKTTSSDTESSLGQDDIEYVEEDIIVRHSAIPGELGGTRDYYYYNQWALGTSNYGINAVDAWDITTGRSDIVVAVIDTGIVAHQDINDQLVQGHDFISDPAFAVDGDGRDSDPTDVGDWVQSGDSCYQGSFERSSWHGSHVAGIIAAKTANRIGIAGTAWHSKILPIRVLGKCGGYTSDIADAIRWAAGGEVSGVPSNRNPAKVINLSLGGQGSCGQYLQSAIDYARSRGSVIVVAAGNESLDLDSNDVAPANCNGIIRVASSNRSGSLSSFSNYGQRIDISAPGEGIYSLSNTGSTTSESESYVSYSGTSMAAPYVSGVVALMMSENDTLYPNQYKSIIKETANTNLICGAKGCGRGIIDAYQAILMAQSEVADSSVGDETNVQREPLSGESTIMQTSSSSGFCGSVAFSKDDDPKGALGILLLVGLIATMIGRFKAKRSL